ncbi:MAG: flagellin [Proteobacteria bacterium]|nr:flagellin [Pseudomonadota bacterium]
MVSSINTNTGAAIGLRQLSAARDNLDKTQSHISTGRKINAPKDDAATLAIAQQLLATFSGTVAVRDGLSRASATLDVAVAAGQSTAGMLVEMKGLAVQANQEVLDQSSRNALNSAFSALRDQIATINDSASFAGSNLIAAGAVDQNVLSDENGGRISVRAQDLSTGGLGVTGLSLDTFGNATGALSALDTAITDAMAKLADLGSSAKRIETHDDLLGIQNDTLRAGIGNLVDADLAAESAALQSNQIKESLGVISLSIANAAPSRMLALFGG